MAQVAIETSASAQAKATAAQAAAIAAAATDATTKVGAHEGDTTAIHGIADTAQIPFKNAANTFTLAQSALVRDKGGQVYNALAAGYGITGDGTTDDTTAAQAFLTALPVGATAYFPPGTYLLDSVTLAVAGVTLLGAGGGQTIFKRKTTTNHDLVIVTAASVTIRGIKFDGNYTNNLNNSFGEIDLRAGADYATIEMCQFVDWPAWLVQTATGLKRTRIRNNYALGAVGAPGGDASANVSNACGFDLQGALDFEVTGNYLEAGGTAINWTDGATYTGSGVGGMIQTQQCVKGTITRNVLVLHHRTNDGITVWAGSGIEVGHNTVLDPHDDGATYRDQTAVLCDGVDFHHNVFDGFGTWAVGSPSGTGHKAVSISHNVCRNGGRYGICPDGLIGGNVSHNKIFNILGRWGTPGAGIQNVAGVIVDTKIDNNVIYETNGTGILLGPTGSVRNSITANHMRNIGWSTSYYGVYVAGPDNAVDNNTINAGGWSGVQGWAAGTGPNPGNGIEVAATALRTSVSGNRIHGRGNRGININTSAVDCKVVNNTVIGTLIASSSVGDGITIKAHRAVVTGNKCHDNEGSGIIVNGANYGTCVGNHSMNNGKNAGAGQRYGLRLLGAMYWTISGNELGDDQGSPTQLYSLSEATTSDFNLIFNNNLLPAGTSGVGTLQKVGASTIVRGNSGFVTEGLFQFSFTETTGAGVYTGSVTVPANALISSIRVWSTVLWTATTSALLDVGDVGDPDGWFTQIDLKATDLLVGEQIDFNNTGGKQGAYLDTATGKRSAAYSASARVVSGILTTIGAAGSAGRSFLQVEYTVIPAVAATKV